MLRLYGIIRRQAAALKQSHVVNKSLLFCFLLITCLSTICSISLPSVALASNYGANGEFYLPENLLSGTATYFIAASDATATEKAQADVICDGKVDQVEINAAITAGYKHIVLSSGTFITSAPIKFISNLWLQGQGPGTIIKIAGDYSGISVTSCTYITLSDLKVDGNSKNTGVGSHAIYFHTGCSEFTDRDIQVVNSHSFSLMFQGCSYGSVDNIYCSSATGAGHDGVHLTDCNNVVVNNIYGSTGDDLFAISGVSADSYHISATNIAGTSNTSICKIVISDVASPGTDIYDIVINGVTGTAPRIVAIESDDHGTISHVNIKNISGNGTIQGILATTVAGGTISDFYIDGFTLIGGSNYAVEMTGITRGSLINGSILNCSDHSLHIDTVTTFKCDNINIKTIFASQLGVVTHNANDLILNNITSEVTSIAFWFSTAASTKVSMTNCKAITPGIGLKHDVDLTDSIIANNDLSEAKIKVVGAGLLTNVIVENNNGYIEPSEVRIARMTASSITAPNGMRVSQQ
ncbi:MAG: glycoside hydrolase family protein [Dehalococcoidia bacterium]